jgi:uncharacterized RDD family membrane protein YckC
MTSFREYRAALAKGSEPVHAVPVMASDAIAFQGDRAGFVSRAVAASIDVFIIVLLVLGTAAVWWVASFIFDPVSPAGASFGSGERIPSLGFFVVYGYCLNVLYWTIGWALGGRTVGNLIMGLRVVNFRGQRVRWGGAFVRALFCTFFIPGLLWVIVSGANRSVQDVVLRTSVIYDWVIGIPGLGRKARATASSAPDRVDDPPVAT